MGSLVKDIASIKSRYGNFITGESRNVNHSTIYPISFKCINRSEIIATNSTALLINWYTGTDSIKVEVTTDVDQDKLATMMIKQGKDLKIDFFRINWRDSESKRCQTLVWC